MLLSAGIIASVVMMPCSEQRGPLFTILKTNFIIQNHEKNNVCNRAVLRIRFVCLGSTAALYLGYRKVSWKDN